MIKSALLDSSVIIDGRIIDIIDSGFITLQPLIPDYVLQEMDQVAADQRDNGHDKANAIKDNLNQLLVRSVNVLQTGVQTDDVDKQLILDAKEHHSAIITNDIELAAIARKDEVKVLVVSELAHKLAPKLSPGDKLTLKLIRSGKNSGQAVGYTATGIMIVVNNATEKIGQEVEVVIENYLSSKNGRIYVASLSPSQKT